MEVILWVPKLMDSGIFPSSKMLIWTETLAVLREFPTASSMMIR